MVAWLCPCHLDISREELWDNQGQKKKNRFPSQVSPEDKQQPPPPLSPCRLPKLPLAVPSLVLDQVDWSPEMLPAPEVVPLLSGRREDIANLPGKFASLSVLGRSYHHALDDTIAILKEVCIRKVYLYWWSGCSVSQFLKRWRLTGVSVQTDILLSGMQP